MILSSRVSDCARVGVRVVSSLEECADTIPVIVKPCPAPPLHSRLTQPGHFGHIIIIHLLSCLFICALKYKHQISEVLKVNIFFASRYIEYGARIHFKDQDNAGDNMWRQEVRSGHQHLESVLLTL